MEKKQEAVDAERGLHGVFILIECSDGTLRAKGTKPPFTQRSGRHSLPPLPAAVNWDWVEIREPEGRGETPGGGCSSPGGPR